MCPVCGRRPVCAAGRSRVRWMHCPVKLCVPLWPMVSSGCTWIPEKGALRIQDHGSAIERLDGTCAFAVGLVASSAIGGIHFFAALGQVVQRPHLGWIVGFGRLLFLLGVNPGSVVGSRQHFYMDGHVCIEHDGYCG